MLSPPLATLYLENKITLDVGAAQRLAMADSGAGGQTDTLGCYLPKRAACRCVARRWLAGGDPELRCIFRPLCGVRSYAEWRSAIPLKVLRLQKDSRR